MTQKLWQVTFSVFLLFGLVMGLVQPYPVQATSVQPSVVLGAGIEKSKPGNQFTLQAAAPSQASKPPENQGTGNAELGIAPNVEKGEEATTEGNGIQATWPGPDGFNYTGSSCTYNWVDITTTGTAITGLSDDNSQGPFDIGFSFPFYGGSETQFFAASNGYLGFGIGTSAFSNQCPLPDTTDPNNLIAMLWDDLNFNISGSAYYQTFPSCPVGSGQCTVVEYADVAHYGGDAGSAGTWETILYPSGKITLQYLNAGNELGSGSTTGIENNNAAANYGLTYACDATASLTNNSCLSFVVTTGPNLGKSVKSAPSLVSPGDLLPYKISVVNNGVSNATSTTMVDPIPTGTTFDHLVTVGLTYNSTLNRVEWSGSVSAGAKVDLEFVVAVDDPATCGGEILNTAVISDPATLAPVSVQATTGIWDNIYFSQDFESSDGGFSAGGTTPSWAWGDVGVYGGSNGPAPSGAHSGTKVWATNLTGDYNPSENSYLTSPAIDLSAAVNVPGTPLELEWWQWLRTESGYDYASVEVRGGSTSWTLVYGPVSGNIDQAWTKHTLDISEFAGLSDFQVRYHLTSDSSVNRPGWYLDDLVLHQCAPPTGLYLSPDTIVSRGCNGSSQDFTMGLYNNTGSNGVFNLSYVLDPAYGTLTGPASIALVNLADQSFDVTLSSEVCLPADVYFNASVAATGNGYNDTTYITRTVLTGGFWEQISDEPASGRMDNAVAAYNGKVWSITGTGSDANVRNYDPALDSWTVVGTPPPFGNNYARSSCQVNDKVFMYGDAATAGFTGLWSYNMTSSAWTQETPSGTPPAQTGIWAPAWVRDSANGYCYMTGGATTAGAGNLATVYAYDPGTNAWLAPLPSFTTVRDFHAAFVFDRPADSHSLLCVAGGSNGAGLTSTQCYDIDAGAWGAENADLGALPADRWGMGYAQKLHAGTQPQLWVVGGVVAGSLSTNTTYYDVLTGSWQDGGDLASTAIYRTAAATLNNEIYKIGGSTGSFNYTGKADHHVQCVACTELGWLDGHVYDYNGTDPTVSPANVHLEPGNIDIPVDANGYYTATLTPFTYHVTASALGYPAAVGPVDVTIVNGSVTPRDFTLSRPDIGINPTDVSVVISAPGVATRNITITNQGTSPLEWEIREAQAALVANAISQANPFDLAKSPVAVGSIQIEPELQAKIDSDGTAGYLIYFRAMPDLSPAFNMSWEARGQFVMKALQETAAQSQARVRAYLDSQGARYQVFWIDNIIAVDSSSRLTFNGLMSFNEIASLRARRTMGIILPEENPLGIEQILGIEPNISHVGADQVWDMGINGLGSVVASIDTGVRYTHQALVNHYRGNLGGGIFDHNYNWFDPYGDHPAAPADDNGHGSHTMGTMVGDDGGANQIGMAPGAKWMACRGCNTSTCTDAALLSCAQFMAAPTDLAGASPDPSMRPNVVNNSWGDCSTSYDNWYQGVVDAWHAAGIYPIFSNGNASNCGYPAPPGLNTVGNPARYGNVTGVGSSGQSNGQYATHSNWGPTDNPDTVNPHPGWADLKPQVLAPGVNIRSSVNTGDSAYQGGWSGTSMSAPHVTGLVALMIQAGPCLAGNYAALETIIENTATPIPYDDGTGGGAHVPNQAAGWGEINAVAAVEAAMNYCGTDWLPWVSESPITGTISALGQQVVQLTFTCSITDSQQTQPLTGVLKVNHNDPEPPNPREVNLSMFCLGQNPVPSWQKEVKVNGVVADPAAGPLVVRPEDVVEVVDWVGATYSDSITADLSELWGDSLTLLSYDTGGVGSVVAGSHSLVWSLDDVAPNVLYPITKTFGVNYNNWTTDTLEESFTVTDAISQLPDKDVQFVKYIPPITLAKDGPGGAMSGSTIPVTLTITSSGNFVGNVVLTDSLPAGMSFVGSLAATYGRAWEDSGIVHWTSYTTIVPPPPPVPQDVIVDGSFEAGSPNPHWSEYSSNFGSPLCTVASCGGTGGGTGPRTGSWWAWFGGISTADETGYLRQNVTIPSGSAKLNFWLQIPVASNGFLKVSVDSTPIFTVTQADAGDYASYTLVSLDVSGYADGGAHTLSFDSTTYSGGTTNFMVDDVSLMVQTGDPLPSEIIITFDVRVAGVPPETIRNTAYLSWGTDWTSAILDVLITGMKLYLPVIVKH